VVGLTRTSLGVIAESADTFILFFTACNKNFYNIPNVWSANNAEAFRGFFASVRFVELRLVRYRLL
jgi:hypothetical protein